MKQEPYCSVTGSDNFEGNYCCPDEGSCPCDICPAFHHKWPTPEQFKEEYGEHPSFESLVWEQRADADSPQPDFKWVPVLYKYADKHRRYEDTDGVFRYGSIVCACTPWGKPPDDWRPE
jgi:hypothetical protein